MKKLLITIMITMALTGCSSIVSTNDAQKTSEIQSTTEATQEPEASQEPEETSVILNDLRIIDTDGDITLELSNEIILDKYNTLKNIFTEIDLNNIAFGTTSTANLFFELGYMPIAAPDSRSLNPELATLQGEATKIEGGGMFDYTGSLPSETYKVGNLGSALALDMETVIAINPSAVFMSDAMPHKEGDFQQLIDAGIQIVSIPQSKVEDIFIVLQVLKDIDQKHASSLNNTLFKMKEEIETAISYVDGEEISVAIIQSAHGKNSIVNDDSVIGNLAKGLGLNNVFGHEESGELNLETLLSTNPDYIVIYGHGEDSQAAIEAFEGLLGDENSVYRGLSAVINQNYVILPPTTGSVTPEITEVLLNLATGVYDNGTN